MSKHISVRVKKHPPICVKFIETLMNESSAMLIRHGENRTDAEIMSRDFVMEVSRQLPGQLMYFGKNTVLNAHTKYGNIRDDYRDGDTIVHLAEKYNLSTRRIRSILFEQKDNTHVRAATTGASAIAVITARMMMKAGLDQNDATSASRGLLAVIAAKFGGKAIYIPRHNYIQDIVRNIEIYRLHKAGKSVRNLAAQFGLSEQDATAIIEMHPVSTLSEASTALSLLNKRVLEVTVEYGCIDSDVSNLLSKAAENVNQACQILIRKEVKNP